MRTLFEKLHKTYDKEGYGTPAYVKTFGMANLEYGVPLSTETVFESGSVAKQFTAAAILVFALRIGLTRLALTPPSL